MMIVRLNHVVIVVRDIAKVAAFFFFQAEDGIRDADVTGVQTCAHPISPTERGASQSSRCTVAGNSPSLRTVAVGGVKPRARRSRCSKPLRRVWLATSCMD